MIYIFVFFIYFLGERWIDQFMENGNCDVYRLQSDDMVVVDMILWRRFCRRLVGSIIMKDC